MTHSNNTQSELEQILFDFQDNSFKPFNLLRDKKISNEECIDRMVKYRKEAIAAIEKLMVRERESELEIALRNLEQSGLYATYYEDRITDLRKN